MKLFVLISQAFARGCAPACLAATGPLVVIMSFTIDPASVPACVRGVPSEGTGLSIPRCHPHPDDAVEQNEYRNPMLSDAAVSVPLDDIKLILHLLSF